MNLWQWLITITLSFALHVAATISFMQSHDAMPPGAKDLGEEGLEVGLGRAGSYQDLIAKVAPEEKAVKPIEPPIEKPKAKPKPKKMPVPAVKEPLPTEKTLQLNSSPKVHAATTVEQKNEDKTGEDDSTQDAMEQSSGKKDDNNSGGFKGNAKDYFSHLMAWLNQYKVYPTELKKAKKQGTVHVQFTIDKSGHVLSSSIKKSSGYKALDNATLEMLQKASPVPAYPDSFNKKRLVLVIPVKYSLINNHYYKD